MMTDRVRQLDDRSGCEATTIGSVLRRALVIAAASLALSGTAAAASHPTLSAKGRHTLTVTGRHFHPGERIRVVLDPARHDPVKHARASGQGTFTVTYRDVPIGPCDGYSISATGSEGSRAMLARMRPDCLVR
jgi:hypothetical protein